MSRKEVLWLRGDGRMEPPPEPWLRLGSESCHQLVPGTPVIERFSSLRDPGELSLVTPLCAPLEFEEVLSAALAAAAAGWGEIVVNDWGVLNRLAHRVPAAITAGRLLLRLRRGPGSLREEAESEEAARRYFAWGPLYDSQFLDLLTEFGVGRLELDPPRFWSPLPAPAGLKLSMHTDHRLVSVTAACPFQIDEENKNQEISMSCDQICLERGPVIMSSPRLEQPLWQWGREILEPARGALEGRDLPPEVDRLITSRFGTESA